MEQFFDQLSSGAILLLAFAASAALWLLIVSFNIAIGWAKESTARGFLVAVTIWGLTLAFAGSYLAFVYKPGTGPGTTYRVMSGPGTGRTFHSSGDFPLMVVLAGLGGLLAGGAAVRSGFRERPGKTGSA